MADDRPGYAFDVGPPPEVARFFRHKGIRPSFSWADVEPEEHAVAFSVAKMAQLDLLADVKAAVQKAIDEGQTFETFQKELTPRLQEAGWWGKKEITDPLTGEIIKAQLGSPRRLRTIYRANLRSAHAAGQWERIQRTKAILPYLEYRLGASEHHRPAHAAHAGMILPVDDPFWDNWMPPNGWGCKCWVRQITRAEADRRGVSSSPDIPDQIVENERTGEVALVPLGIDPGWHRNPGQLRLQAMEAALHGKLADLPDQVARVALRDMAQSWRVQRVAEGAPGSVTIGLLDEDIVRQIPNANREVLFTDRTAKHVFEEHNDRQRADLALAADLMNASRIALTENARGLRTIIAEVAIPDTTNLLRFYIHLHKDGQYLGSMHRVHPTKFDKLVAKTGGRVLKR